MLSLLIIAFLYHLITGKDTTYLLEKIKVLNLERKLLFLLRKIKNMFLGAIRFMFRTLLRFFYIMIAKETSWFDKVLVIGGLCYVFIKSDFFPYKYMGFVGSIDDLAVLLLLLLILWKDCTPSVNDKAEAVVQHFFGFKQNACSPQ